MKKPIPFGRYFLLDRLNVGGMAEVFLAKAFGAEGFEKLLAIKRILPNIAEDEEFRTMFIDEAKISVQLTHANIAQVFDMGNVDGNYFIAMEFIHGRDVRAIYDRCRKNGDIMPLGMACYMIARAAEGLDYAHRKKNARGEQLNIVHRDISPQNILVSYEGEVKVIDFGIAKATDKATKTQAGILKGKFGYMSPEQVRGYPLDRRSDLFSLGIVLYELITGERLFVGESDFETLEKVRNVEVMPPTTFNRKIPKDLEAIVMKMLAKDPDTRYQWCSEAAEALQRFMMLNTEFNFTRTDLANYMKQTFEPEYNRDLKRHEEFRSVTAESVQGLSAPPSRQESPKAPLTPRAPPPAPPKTGLQPRTPAAPQAPPPPPPAAPSSAQAVKVLGGGHEYRPPDASGGGLELAIDPNKDELPKTRFDRRNTEQGMGQARPAPDSGPVQAPRLSSGTQSLPALGSKRSPMPTAGGTGRSKAPASNRIMILAAASLLIIGGGAAAFFLLRKPETPGKPTVSPDKPVAAAPTSNLTVHVVPNWAVVRIDGMHARGDRGPYDFKQLPRGRHRMVIEAPGYEKVERDLEIVSEKELISEEMRPVNMENTGVLRIDTKPRGMSVIVNGKSVGTTPVTVSALPVGPEHQVTIISPDGRHDRVVRTREKRETLIFYPEDEMPDIRPAQPVQPPPQPVVRDGGKLQELGETPPDAVAVEDTTPGLLTINSQPFSQVSVDGKKLNNVGPVYQHRLPNGKHKIKLENPNFNYTAEFEVDIKPGKHAVVSKNQQNPHTVVYKDAPPDKLKGP
ncbi:MAG: Serine/threonine-protein kinase PknD [Myxococcota bacterium]|nr:Serine/threonine-protein kinase PknD [Myxococcota bacterium]